MSLLLSPIAITPLLKVPLLLSNATCTYYGMKPPTPIAKPQERAKYAKGDFMGRLWTPNVMVNLAVGLRATLCGVTILEAAALLAEHIPSSITGRLLALFLPGASTRSNALFITPMFLVGSALAISGGLIRIACHRALGRFFSWQLSVQDDHRLITTGPYSVVRHPSYSGWLLLVAGKALALLSPGSYFVESGLSSTTAGRVGAGVVFGYLAFVTVVLLRRIPKEDEVLSKEFGEEWQAWTKRTPYRLLPFVY
ncbi:hypothetical protein C8Q77DRAFT_1071217 [Trametes polyzona]|nr:hypothetical protein C8Q77DRAFT_1071217 [Trametes polyzona]